MTQPPRTLMMGAPSEVSPQHLPSAYPGGEARLTRNAPSPSNREKYRENVGNGASGAPSRRQSATKLNRLRGNSLPRMNREFGGAKHKTTGNGSGPNREFADLARFGCLLRGGIGFVS